MNVRFKIRILLLLLIISSTGVVYAREAEDAQPPAEFLEINAADTTPGLEIPPPSSAAKVKKLSAAKKAEAISKAKKKKKTSKKKAATKQKKQLESPVNASDLQPDTKTAAEIEDAKLYEEFLAMKAKKNNPYDASQLKTIETGNQLIIGLDHILGYTLYQIGGKVTLDNMYTWRQLNPTSELKFPVNSDLFNLSLTNKTGTRQTKLSLSFTLNKARGIMEDSDWTTTGNPTQKDIYSTSTAKFNAIIFDLGASWDINPNPGHNQRNTGGITAGLGYTIQYFDYLMYDVNQYSPSNKYPAASLKQSGEIGKYRVIYQIPYLNIGYTANLSVFTADIGISYAPYIKANDQDDHMLRGIIMKGESTGTAVLGRLELAARIMEPLTLWVKYNATAINTTGIQKQKYYNNLSESDYGTLPNGIDSEVAIEQKLESRQNNFSCGASLVF